MCGKTETSMSTPWSVSYTHLNVNKFDEKIKVFDKSTEINPQDSDTWYNQGNPLFNLNKFDERIKAFDKSTEFNPQDSDTWYNKGNALSNVNKFDEKIKADVYKRQPLDYT